MSYRFIRYKKNHKKRSIDYQKAIARNKQRNMVIKSAREAKQTKR